MHGCARILERHSIRVNRVINVFLSSLCIISYVFLIVLYFSSGMNVASLTHIDNDTLSPTTAISIFVIILTGATSALLTRAVEHGLWNTLLKDPKYSKCDHAESHRKAQWTVSPLGRLLYTFWGHSWVLRLGGILLFGTALLNPVLLYGVRPSAVIHSADHPANKPWMEGFMPYSTSMSAKDDVMLLAIQSSSDNLLNMRPPPANVCSGNRCNITANATALQADCKPSSRSLSNQDAAIELDQHEISWPQGIHIPWLNLDGTPHSIYGAIYCSASSNVTCVTLTSLEDYNFTSGFSDGCYQAFEADGKSNIDHRECPPGDFAVIFGAWFTQGPNDTYNLHKVDCRLQYGYVQMQQSGDASPGFARTSFTPSTERISHYTLYPDRNASYEQNSTVGDLAYSLQWEYLKGTTLWSFAYSAVWNQTPASDNPIVSYVLAAKSRSDTADGEYAVNDTQIVAQTVQASFDMATRIAFSRVPHSAFLTISISAGSHWKYNPWVLLILAVPILATVLVLHEYRQVYSDDVVIGYDPLKIAQRADEILGTRLNIDEESDHSERTASSAIVNASSSYGSRHPSLDDRAYEGENDSSRSLMLPTISYTGFACDIERRSVSPVGSEDSCPDSRVELSNQSDE